MEQDTKEKEILKFGIREAVFHSFSKDVVIVMGFGSYWQMPEQLNSNSDIDFFVLLKREPDIEQVLCFKKAIYALNYSYILSPHIFVGSLPDLVRGEDNFIRILNIYDPKRQLPEIIAGDENINLLELHSYSNEQVLEMLKANLFRTTRFFNKEILLHLSEVDTQFLSDKAKQIHRFIETFHIADELVWQKKKQMVTKELNYLYHEFEKRKELSISSVMQLLHDVNNIVLGEDNYGRVNCYNRNKWMR